MMKTFLSGDRHTMEISRPSEEEKKAQNLWINTERLVRQFKDFGLTPELAKQWLLTVQEPTQKWIDSLQLTTADDERQRQIMTLRSQIEQEVRDGFVNFITANPNLPPEIIRPLTAESIGRCLWKPSGVAGDI